MTQRHSSPAQPWGVTDVAWVRMRDEVRRSIGVLDSLARLKPSDVIRRHPPRPGPDLISVVIPMRNAREWIDLCLKSTLGQTHDNLEVFCVDDASTDDSYQRAVDEFGTDGRLRIIRLKRRVGPYQIKNWAIASLARGHFVAMQDADDVSHPMRFAFQLRWMREHRFQVSGTYAHQFSTDGSQLVWGTRPAIRVRGQLHNRVLYPTIRAIRTPEVFRKLFGRIPLAKHGSQIYESSVLREFGGFDGRTLISGDTDLNWRLLRFLDLGNVPRVLYSRRIHSASLTRHPETGRGTPMREAQLARYEELQRRVAQHIAAGNAQAVRSLCTQDFFHGDVEVEEVHAGGVAFERWGPPEARGRRDHALGVTE